MSVNKRYPLPSANYGHAQPWNSAINAEPLPAIFERQAQAIPNTVLAEFMGRDFTYRELYAEARRFAAGLIARGIAPKDRVGLFLPNVPAYVAAYYGAMMAGAVVVNFSPLYTAEELAAGHLDLALLTVPELRELKMSLGVKGTTSTKAVGGGLGSDAPEREKREK